MGVAAFALALGLKRLWHTAWLRRVFLSSDESTSQLRVRGAFVVLLLFAGLAHRFGADALLGAFIAGIVLTISDQDNRPNQEAYWGKLQAIGYGFLVPVFFVVTGVQMDVRSLASDPASLALVPLLLVAVCLARGLPALIFRGQLGTRPAVAAGLLQATTLTFPVVVASVGLDLRLIDRATATALIGAALVSVLVFPAASLALRPWTIEKVSRTPAH